MIIETWADLVEGLDRALAFVRSIGLDEEAEASRFKLFRDRLSSLAQILEGEGGNAALDCFDADRELNAVALTESHEFLTILPYLQSLPPERVKAKLKIVLRGPDRPTREEKGSSEPRDTMFELNVAARLHRAGIPVEIGQEADLQFTWGGMRWFGECKRPYQAESIETSLERACCQLERRFASTRLAARGIIAISVSRPLNSRAPYFEYSGAKRLRASLKQHVRNMARLIKVRIQELESCRRQTGLGLLIVHLLMPGWDLAARIPTAVQYSAGADLSRDGRLDGQRLWIAIEGTFNR